MAFLIQLAKSSKLIHIGRHRKYCKRSGFDRRWTQDRREQQEAFHSSMMGKKEKRVFVERRFQNERREGWVRTSRWSSFFVDITA